MITDSTRRTLVILALVAGCAVPPTDRQSHQRAYREALVSRAAEAPRTPEEGEPELGPSSGIEDYVRFAVLHNPGLQAAFASWQAALERVPQARALADPRFTYRYYVDEVETRVGPQDQGFGLSQAFPWFGKLALAGDVAFERSEVLRQNFVAHRLALEAEVRTAFCEYAYAERAVDLLAQNLELVQHMEEVARIRYSTGGADHPDISRAQIELGVVEDRLATLVDRRTPLRARVNAALGREPQAPLPGPMTLEPLELRLGDDEVLALVARWNPELRAGSHAIAAASHATELAEKERFPDFAIGLDYISTGEAVTAGVPDSGKDPLLVSLSLELPLQRERIAAGIRGAREDLRAARLRRDDLAHTLATRAATTLFRLRDATRKIALFGETLIPRATDSLAATETTYRAGNASFLELVDAEQLLLEFQLEHERARADQGREWAELERLVGGSLAEVANLEDTL